MHHGQLQGSALRILILIVCGVIAIGGYWVRWQWASAQSNANAAQQAAERAWSQQLLQHPALSHLLAFIRAQGIAAGFGPAGPGQFEIVLLSVTTALGLPTSPQDPQVAYLQAYLEGPKRLMVGMSLQTGQAAITELGFLQWRADMHAVRFPRTR